MRVEAGSDLTFALPLVFGSMEVRRKAQQEPPWQKNPARTSISWRFSCFWEASAILRIPAFSENSVYFLNVSEALATPSDKLKAARLFGTVAEDGLSRSETGRDVKFRLEDQENKATTLWVEYTGAIPDTFKAGAEVIVEGGLRPDGSFQAKTLMTKCPSKYQKENRG